MSTLIKQNTWTFINTNWKSRHLLAMILFKHQKHANWQDSIFQPNNFYNRNLSKSACEMIRWCIFICHMNKKTSFHWHEKPGILVHTLHIGWSKNGTTTTDEPLFWYWSHKFHKFCIGALSHIFDQIVHFQIN